MFDAMRFFDPLLQVAKKCGTCATIRWAFQLFTDCQTPYHRAGTSAENRGIPCNGRQRDVSTAGQGRSQQTDEHEIAPEI